MDQHIVIYTCRTDGETALYQPFAAEKWQKEGFEFICFLSHKGSNPDRIGAWKIEELPISWNDDVLNMNMPKLNPQSVLEECEYSVWIDSNVRITDDSFYEICMRLAEKDTLYAGLRHKSCDCAYEEARRLWDNRYEEIGTLLKTVKFLSGKKLRKHAGLQNTAVIFRKHEDEAVLEFDRWWWECLVTKAAGHFDLLLHTFCLIDTPSLKWEYLDYEGFEILDSPAPKRHEAEPTKMEQLQFELYTKLLAR